MQDEKLTENADELRGQSAGAPDKDPELVEQAAAAHFAAEHDMDDDPELAPTDDPAADLDEGELARLDNNNDNQDV